MAAGKILQIKRGIASSLVTLAVGELGLTTDTKLLYVGNGTTNDLIGGIGVVRDVAAGITLTAGDLTLKEAPSTDLMAATKKYVDDKAAASAAGLDIKDSVRAATVIAGTLASSFANGSVVDTATLATGNRILIKNQASGAENGIYTVNASGAPTRSTDMPVGVISDGAFCFVEEGSQADTGWIMMNTGVTTVGTTALVFTQFNAATTDATKIPLSIATAKGDIISASGSAAFVRLAVGDNNQVLTALSTAAGGVVWAAPPLDSSKIPNSVITAKGDIIGAIGASTPTHISVGTDGQVLTAHSAASTGVDWETLVAFNADYGAFA